MDGSGIILLVLLGVMVVFMFLSTKRQRKAQEEQLTKLNELKEGDKVRTYTGIYATLKRTYDSTDGKIAVLELGVGENKIEFEMEMRLIIGKDEKTEVTFDEEPSIETANTEENIKQEEIEKAKDDIKEKLEEEKSSTKANEKYDDENTGNE